MKHLSLMVDSQIEACMLALMTLLHRAMLAASWILQWQIITHKSVQPQNTPYFI